MLKMQTKQGYLNFLVSYFKIVGIWIKMKCIKKLQMSILTKEAKNYSKLMIFILMGHISPTPYTCVVLFGKMP